MFFDPYVHGTLFTNLNVASVWGGIGGYFTASVGALGVARTLWLAPSTPSHLSRRLDDHRTLWRVELLGTGAGGGTSSPLIENVSFGRYIMSSCELSFILLAAFGLMDLAESARAKRTLHGDDLGDALGLIWIVLASSSLNKGIIYGHRARYIYAFLDAIPFIAIIALLVLGLLTKYRSCRCSWRWYWSASPC